MPKLLGFFAASNYPKPEICKHFLGWSAKSLGTHKAHLAGVSRKGWNVSRHPNCSGDLGHPESKTLLKVFKLCKILLGHTQYTQGHPPLSDFRQFSLDTWNTMVHPRTPSVFRFCKIPLGHPGHPVHQGTLRDTLCFACLSKYFFKIFKPLEILCLKETSSKRRKTFVGALIT